MKRILFVDDEPHLLDGLKRMLRPQRHEWEMAFAADGPAALAVLATAPYDAVVSDMRMPGMDGAALLTAIGEQYPGIVRIVLSGYTELAASVRAVPVAHQCLPKPCDAVVLRSTIDRQMKVMDRFQSRPAAELVGSVRALSASPRAFAQLRESVTESQPSLDRVADIVTRDVALSARILHLANSAFFGHQRDVADIADIRAAVACLGTDILGHLVLAGEVFQEFRPPALVPGFTMEHFQRHSTLTGGIAEQMAGGSALGPTFFVAGLLHDIGKLVLADHDGERLDRAQAVARAEGRREDEVEAECFGLSHAEIGGYLLALWGLPDAVVEGVTNHHHPEHASPEAREVSAAIYVANWLAKPHGPADPRNASHPRDAIDREVLALLGGERKLPDWQVMAAAVARATEAASV